MLLLLSLHHGILCALCVSVVKYLCALRPFVVNLD